MSVSAQRLNGTGLGVPSMLVGLLDPHLLTVQVLHYSLGILHELLHILDDKKIKSSLTSLLPLGFFTQLHREGTLLWSLLLWSYREREQTVTGYVNAPLSLHISKHEKILCH